MKKYKVSTWSILISEVEIERETNSSVFFKIGNKERREAKESSYSAYFDSFEEAKKHLIDRTIRELESKKNSVKKLEKDLLTIKGLKKS